jgi:hypothetical protein
MNLLILTLCFTGVVSQGCFTPATSAFNVSLFNSWAASQIAAGSTTLCVTPGSYTLVTPPPGVRAHFVFPAFTGIALEFTGVTLTCESRYVGALYLGGWESSSLRGLTVRYAQPPSNTAVVRAVDLVASTMDLEVEVGHPSTDFVSGVVRDCNLFDPLHRLRVPLSYDISLTNVTALGNGLYRCGANKNTISDVIPGMLLGCRVSGGMTVLLDSITNSRLEDVALYGGPAFGFLESRGSGNTYVNLSIRLPDPPPGAATRPLLSTSADGFHSSGTRVGPTILGCSFTGMDDDGIAIHGSLMLVTDADEGSSSVTLVNLGPLAVGDRLALYDKTFSPIPPPSPPLYFPTLLTILSLTPAPRNYTPPFNVSTTMPSQTFPASYVVVGLSSPPPPGAGFDWVATNLDGVGGGYHLENNTISNHRARGMLLKAPNGTVRGNTITNSSLGGIIITPELYWREAGWSHNLSVVANSVTLTSTGIQSYGGIALGGVAPGHSLVTGAGHSAISITGNTLKDCGYSPVWLNAGGGVTFSNNTLITPFHSGNASLLPNCCEPLPAQKIAVYALNVQGLTVEGNCVTPAPNGESSLQFLLNVSGSTGSWEGGVSVC